MFGLGIVELLVILAVFILVLWLHVAMLRRMRA